MFNSWSIGAGTPQIGSVVNGASLTNTGLSPGLIFTIFGSGLGPVNGQTLELDQNGDVSSYLAGITVSVNGTYAPLLYVGSGQINAVAPYEIASSAGQNVTRAGIRRQSIEQHDDCRRGLSRPRHLFARQRTRRHPQSGWERERTRQSGRPRILHSKSMAPAKAKPIRRAWTDKSPMKLWQTCPAGEPVLPHHRWPTRYLHLRRNGPPIVRRFFAGECANPGQPGARQSSGNSQARERYQRAAECGSEVVGGHRSLKRKSLVRVESTDSRKTERGERHFLACFVVHAAPFALSATPGKTKRSTLPSSG